MSCLRDNFQSGVLLDGRYQTLSPLNSGSFGMVFKAKDTFTGETVAIKCLAKTPDADDECMAFAVDDKSEEKQLHGRLSHHNIVNLLRAFETESHSYLVLEFCSRGDLYEAIRNGHGPLETEHVRQFMLELVDAVTYIHKMGVYHRDIKPENIFLTQSGAMKLGDFGLATKDQWTFETTVGSDRYMSPEQYDSAGAGYSPAQADIWAIGICLLNVLFSRNPFTTPTEADPLFLDFSRDKQSLFDVFPSMSQDTYEVIVQLMSLDPKKRSLVGARAALLRLVSFTTSEEDMDDFCSTEKPVVASANREPLRTPSIQSPMVDNGAFPWTKALHTTPPKPIRQLSVIPDDESYTEDLFSKSGGTAGWFSGSIEAPSFSSTFNSTLTMGTSMKSMAIQRPVPAVSRPPPRTSAISGSLPVTMSKPRNVHSSGSLGFGRLSDVVSKSWSDMWDEDIEEEEEEARQQLESLRAMNSRTWSQESKSAEADQATVVADNASVVHNDVDDDLVADGFFFQEAPAPKPSTVDMSTRYSPPPKRSNVDKWAALGQRRRALAGQSEPNKTPDWLKPRRPSVTAHQPTPVTGFWEQYGLNIQTSNKTVKERNKDCPWNKGRDWNYWRRDKRSELGDVEWVGGWQEAHS
ncbi:hypothetical protein VD0002_g5921 [Verticillium dahliae]|uniref:Serine/threonine-protein kinase ksp1 n=2 Tax=Verticillium dahliae TaxID=27337 RepID=G2X752_VERDV|nr:serine/threonine-protein kinase ksp1 [Verticillium dahliae VdLs.17]KAF3347437.1 GRIP domain-containing protein [Verticillium dahliae VDG2]KAH6694744.1 serine/threonine-protein kinase ksp1 [Verticillium dahliae]EGY14820.1 serine/threonine-protein kinase ksp1 [Verticillium dahliae VdLs.17]PNH32303.1 hypothetical protein BJF96_g4617 [Verticillium dahliae]PNH51590.1 hypothetical protein VD0003_g5674 [Verticillium dahliae]